MHDAAIDALRWREIYAAGGAALMLTLAVLLLAPAPEREADHAVPPGVLLRWSVLRSRRAGFKNPPTCGPLRRCAEAGSVGFSE